jgi:hypothetical protein
MKNGVVWDVMLPHGVTSQKTSFFSLLLIYDLFNDTISV